jgi:hypothetical protein
MNKAILTALSGLALSLPALAAPIPPLPPVDNGLTTTVPHFGVSRIETVSMCLTDAGVQRYQDLITDMHWESFTDCMTSNT